MLDVVGGRGRCGWGLESCYNGSHDLEYASKHYELVHIHHTACAHLVYLLLSVQLELCVSLTFSEDIGACPWEKLVN